jgi:MFS family permease
MASGLNRAPTLGLISMHTSGSEQGAILGVTQSAGTLGRIFGPLLATTAYKYLPHSPYLGAAALCLMAGLISLRKLRNISGAKTEPAAV